MLFVPTPNLRPDKEALLISFLPVRITLNTYKGFINGYSSRSFRKTRLD